MTEGIAQYAERSVEGKEPYRILVGEHALRSMDKTFEGRPLYVRHVDNVDVSKIGKADPESPTGDTKEEGYVVESFFNPADGKHWVKMLVVGDRARQAIAQGWKLSNAYEVGEWGSGGDWHGVPYEKEVMSANYDHMAIVDDPRYQESKILTPEEFQKYNEERIAATKRLMNSKADKKGDTSMKFSFFKKEKVENSKDLEQYSVTLPKSGKEVALADLVTNADEMEMKKNEPVMADPEHKVKLNSGEELSINELVSKYEECMKAMPKNGEDEIDSQDLENEMDEEEKKKNAAEEEEKKKNEAEDKKKKDAEMKNALATERKEKQDRHDRLANAHLDTVDGEKPAYETLKDGVARGAARY